MTYTAPNRDVLRTGLARDLRDPDGTTFTDDELNDLINYSIVEVSRVYAKEDVQEYGITEDAQRSIDCDAMALFRVEVIKEGAVVFGIPENKLVDASEGGWDLHAGILWLPMYVSNRLYVEESHSVRAWGYWEREVFSDDVAVLDGDAETEFAVRAHSAMLGYQRLQNDRLLFQQWLTNTGNTDVSPNQLSQTADLYQNQWRETRNRLRSLQRV